MNQIKMRKILLFANAVIVLFCVLAVALFVQKPVSASEQSLFTESDGVKTDAELPENTQIDDERKGVLISSAKSGKTFTFADTFTGKFSLDFRAFSDTVYDNPNISGSKYVNNYTDFEEIKITVTDKNDAENVFSIVIGAGSYENFVTPNARVEYGGTEAGIYYDQNIQNSVNGWATWGGKNQTKVKNGMGLYTYLTGSSFCNKAYYGYTFASPDSTTILFDPETMQVSTYAYDVEKVLGERLILDLDAGLNDSFATPVIKGFSQYSVSITLNEIKDGQTANVLLYSLNGQALSGAEFTDDTAPNIYADLNGIAEKGSRFDLMPVYVYDVIDGASDFNGSIVCDIDGYEQEVKIDNGVSYVVPDRSGTLTVRYKTGDAAGNRAEWIKSLFVEDGIFDIKHEIDVLPSGEYGTGERIYLDGISFASEYADELRFCVTLMDETGAVVGGIDETPLTYPIEYTFEKAGKFYLTITAEGFCDKLVYEYSVTDSAVAFVLSKNFADSYKQGERLDLPVVTVSSGGKKAEAKLTVRTPSGNNISVSDFVYLTEYGKYTLTYGASLDGKVYEKSYDIFVGQTENDFISDTVTESKNSVSAYFDDVTGTLLKPKTTAGESVTYNRTVDLSTFDDNLFLKFYSMALPNELGSFPTIKITDVYDQTNFVTVKLTENLDSTYASFVSVIDYSINNGLRTFRGQTMYAPTGSSPNGRDGAAFKLFYDWEDRAIYANYWSDRNESYVCYLDELLPSWKGFTTGEVTISFTLTQPVLVTDIGGFTFGQSDLKDRIAPVINIDTEEYVVYPDAIVGMSYPLFSAHAYDETSGKCKVSTAVYTDYDSPYRRIVSVDSEFFTPPSEGEYTVEYTAEDQSGNLAKKLMSVTAKASSAFEDLQLTLSEEVAEKGIVGETIEIPEIIEKKGGTGEIEAEIFLTLPSGERNAVKTSFVPEEDGDYKLEYVLTDYIGQTETFSYTIKVEIEYKPVLEKIELPFKYVLSGSEIEFPACKGEQYLNGKMEEIPVKIELTIGDNAPVVLDNDFTYTPVIPANSKEEMKICYYAENSYGRTELPEMNVTVVNPYTDESGRFDMKKYFAVSEGTEITSDSLWAYLQFDFDKDSEIAFVNKLLTKRISAQFSVPSASVDTIVLTLTDSLDSDISVELKYHKIENDTQNCNFQINDGIIYSVSGGFGGTNNITMAYSDTTFLISDGGNSVIAQVTETVNGEEFRGFTSGYVYLTIATEGAEKGSSLKIAKINGQTFSDMNNITRPLVEYETDYFIESDLKLGETLKVPAIEVNSVLFGIRNVTVTISANGKTVVEKQPADKEYSFEITQNDRCRIVYEAETFFGKPVTVATFYSNIIEYEPPVITVEKAPKAKVKKGDRVTIYNATAKDNVSGEGSLYPSTLSDSEKNRLTVVCQVFVVSPSLKISQLYSDNLSFIAEEKGTYTVRYYAYDENHNFSVVEYKVAVN